MLYIKVEYFLQEMEQDAYGFDVDMECRRNYQWEGGNMWRVVICFTYRPSNLKDWLIRWSQ
jgi:hypothetical protein